jgi:hypothetical protein
VFRRPDSAQSQEDLELKHEYRKAIQQEWRYALDDARMEARYAAEQQQAARARALATASSAVSAPPASS